MSTLLPIPGHLLTSPVPLVLASGLSLHGLRKGSLSPAGAGAAWVVGLVMMAAPLNVFGVTLIVFYLAGSRATKFGKKRKQQLEEGYHEAGYRGAWQVLCNSLSAVVACIVWWGLFGGEYKGQWCPLDEAVGDGWSRGLVFATLGHFGCCLGDTLASELGILSRGRPVLITTLRRVPAGTNGGVSVGGTLASAAGGVIMGATVAACLVVENVECRRGWTGLAGPVVIWGATAGVFGSVVDSLLGATVQRTAVRDGKVSSDGGGTAINGWDILSNNQVNLVSSAFTAVVLGVIVSYHV